MRIAALLVLLLGALPSAGTAQERSALSNPKIHAEEARVLAIEDAYVAAVAGDKRADPHRDEIFRFNSDRGITTDKEELIQGVLKMSMVGQTVTERSVLLEGELALVFGTSEIVIAQALAATFDFPAALHRPVRQSRRAAAYAALQMQKRASK